MADVPTISITKPDMESQGTPQRSPSSPSPPGSPTIFDVVKNMEALDRDDMYEKDITAEEEHPNDASEEHGDDQQGKNGFQNEGDGSANTDSPQLSDHDAPNPQMHTVEQLEVASASPDPREFYADKTVLLTGATGFVGKALLWKLLTLDVKKVYVLVRTGVRRFGSTGDRVYDDILSNKAFVALRRSMGPTAFDRMVKVKIHIVPGDLSKPGLGLADEDRKMLVKETNVIFHCGAIVDGSEPLDIVTKVNVLGTMELVDIANECMMLGAFIFLSPLQVQHSSPFEDRLFAVPNQDPYNVIQQILSSKPEDLQSVLDSCRLQYPDAYLLTKSLAEHLLAKEVQKIRENGAYHYPLAILRSSPIGPSACEPLVGWADGVNGFNGTILLTGRGTRVIQPGSGDAPADVVPVDFAVRMIIGCAATIRTPSRDFIIPSPDPIIDGSTEPRRSLTLTDSDSVRISGSVADDISMSRSSSVSRASSRTSVREDSLVLKTNVFPYIYHLTMTNMRCLSWKQAYEPIRQYWMRATKNILPPADAYFTTNTGLNRARTVMNSIRSAASSYMASPSPSASSTSADIRARKRSSHRFSNYIDKATRLQPTIRSLYKTTSVSDTNAAVLRHVLQTTEVDPHSIVPEDVDHGFWRNYFLNACYGIHFFVCAEPNLRLPVPLLGWTCALRPYDVHGDDAGRLIDRQAESAVFSPDQIAKRITRMVTQIKDVLTSSEYQKNAQDDERWLGDMDDSLDDWSQDAAVFNSDKEARMVLGKWRKKVGSHDDKVKIVILNDRRVNNAIHQIISNAGVPKQTAINEANKILVRMSERTQLQFVWFAGHFLKSLFDDMFENVRIQEDSIRRIHAATLGKRVVYVPVTKSVLDPLLVWYIAIRYQLPVPAFACDESLAQLGPLSDIYRLSGAYYVKRDKQERSPLNSAVMAAYTQVLLREHGALSMTLERSRSRSGKYQAAYDDGLVEMIVESTLQSNQNFSATRARVPSMENSPPASPDTPSTIGSPTMSVDSSISHTLKVHRDVLLVPINITYESLPELPYLLNDILDHQPSKQPIGLNKTSSQAFIRPSEAVDRRNKGVESSENQRKFGRVLVGVGRLVSVQDAVEESMRLSSGSVNDPTDESVIVRKITKQVQENQRKALVVSPVSIVASIILYGRSTGGVSFGKMKDMAEWLRAEVIMRGFQIDWEDGEDVASVVLYTFRLLDDSRNIIIEGKEVTDDTNIRVSDHADNVLALAYYANQIIDIFLLDAFFAVVYLSFTESAVTEDEFMDRFHFLVQIFEREFVLNWEIDEQFKSVLSMYVQRKVIRKLKDDKGVSRLQLAANIENNSVRYEQLLFLGSILYPTIDSYWITSCSLSALEAVPMLPRSIVPLLTQWIATHLITGRRTIYREVLSTESSRTAADMFMAMGFLNEISARQKLSPDAQILLHELGIPTSESLIVLSGHSNGEKVQTPVTSEDPAELMKALMAQIQMNRANSNLADLCQQIDSYRLGSTSQRETFQNKQVFQKCLKQIKGILQANTSFAKKRQLSLPENEERLVQLVHALRTSSTPSVSRTRDTRALRRISEAYSLRH
ncbi:male sterility protein-domain-containing protein [Dichotomocladium elegans]|nr:male sterility protein-domain-containing protein [Dichotomocladium elegans]